MSHRHADKLPGGRQGKVRSADLPSRAGPPGRLAPAGPPAPPLARRTFLRGLGTCLALPFLDAMLPVGPLRGLAHGAAPAPAGPVRFAFLYVPNGVHMPSWTPAAEGARFQLPAILTPLRPFQNDVLVLSGLTQDRARPHGDGPGDHARAAAAFLTGCQPLKTGGANLRAGVSVDQVLAERVGKATRFPSLELGCEEGAQSGNCDSGYSCAYSNNISWKSESMFLAKETEPRLLFERLFPSLTSRATESARKYRSSVLDFVEEDARKLRPGLGASDRRKLDEYLAGVREIEERLARAEREARERKTAEKPPAGASKLAASLPASAPGDYGEHLRLMGDLLVLAFQADLTRVATFMFANEGSNRSFKEIGVPEGHHDLSHHGNEKSKQEKLETINTFQVTQLAYILKRLREAREGAGSLLDHSVILYGSGISDGNAHNHNELPVLLAGKGRGLLKPGRHLRFPKNTPLNNLFVKLLDGAGCPVPSLGDSNGRLEGLT